MNSPFHTVKLLDLNPIPSHPGLTSDAARAELAMRAALDDAPEVFLSTFPYATQFTYQHDQIERVRVDLRPYWQSYVSENRPA